MRRTSYVRRRSRMHQFDLIITECIGCCKFFNSSNDRFSNPDAHANRFSNPDAHANRFSNPDAHANRFSNPDAHANRFSRNSRLDLVLRSRDRLSILRRI